MGEITIYTTSTCNDCSKAKRFLRQMGVNFREKDIFLTPDALDEWQRVNGYGTQLPLIKVGRDYLSGFNPFELKALLTERI